MGTVVTVWEGLAVSGEQVGSAGREWWDQGSKQGPWGFGEGQVGSAGGLVGSRRVFVGPEGLGEIGRASGVHWRIGGIRGKATSVGRLLGSRRVW